MRKLVLVILILSCLWETISCCIGIVSPVDDVNLKVGSDLNVTCKLESCKYSPEGIFWVVTYPSSGAKPEPVNRNFITVTSNTTAQLYVPSVSVDNSGIYSCQLKENDTKIPLGDKINNVVNVLYPPLTNYSVTCTSYNFINMTCQWTDANLPSVDSYWSLKYNFNKNWQPCKPKENSNRTCVLPANNSNGYPIISPLKLVLKVTNKLGREKFRFNLSQYENLILKPPQFSDEKIKINDKNATISWINRTSSLILHENTSIYLQYNLTYKSQWGTKVMLIDDNVTIILKDLIPNTNYSLSLRARCQVENSDNEWSEPTVMNFTTKSTIPESWNAFTAGIFERIYDKVTIYWRALPLKYQNGDNFVYEISNVDRNSSFTTTQTEGIFYNLSQNENYEISLFGKNDVGKSHASSTLQISSVQKGPSTPKMYDVVDLGNDNYQIEWELDQNASVTVFWCSVPVPNNNQMATKCKNGGIDWKKIDSNKTKEVLSFPSSDNSKRYKFAVASRIGDQSRGLVWSDCTIPKRKTPIPVIKDITSNYIQHENRIDVEWKLLCEDRFQSIWGFRLYYSTTSEEMKNISLSQNSSCKYRGSICNYTLTDVVSDENYSISLTILTSNAEGKKSTPQFVSTTNLSIESTSIALTVALVTSAILFAFVVTISVGVVVYRRCFREQLKALKNLTLPAGLIAKSDIFELDLNSNNSSPTDTQPFTFKTESILSEALENKNNEQINLSQTSIVSSGFISQSVSSFEENSDNPSDDSSEEPFGKKTNKSGENQISLGYIKALDSVNSSQVSINCWPSQVEVNFPENIFQTLNVNITGTSVSPNSGYVTSGKTNKLPLPVETVDDTVASVSPTRGYVTIGISNNLPPTVEAGNSCNELPSEEEVVANCDNELSSQMEPFVNCGYVTIEKSNELASEVESSVNFGNELPLIEEPVVNYDHELPTEVEPVVNYVRVSTLIR